MREPILMMVLALSFLEWYRYIYGVVFLIFLVLCLAYMRRNALNLQQILMNADLDRRERQNVMLELQRAATQLAERTEKTVQASLIAEHQRDQIIKSLHDKIDNNTQLTIAAASASENAAEVANSMNRKIDDTNERLLEVVQREEKK